MIHFNGKERPREVQIWKIGETTLEYEKEGSLHDVAIADIRALECAGEEYRVDAGRLVKVPRSPNTFHYRGRSRKTNSRGLTIDTTLSMDQLGKLHADELYNGTGAMIASTLTCGTFFIPPLIAAIPPNTEKMAEDIDLYHTNAEYRKSFKKRAHGKKAGRVALGTGIGFLVLALLML
jgi:hypothetical protein